MSSHLARPARRRQATKLRLKPGMDKSASLLGAATVGLVGHLGANAAFKGARSAGSFSSHVAPGLKKGGKLTLMQRAKDAIGKGFNRNQSKQVEDGMLRSLAGKGHGTTQKLVETWAAPEFMAGSHLGAMLGKGLGKMPAKERLPALEKLRAAIAKDPDFFRNAPGANHIVGGLDRVIARSQAANRLGNVPSFLEPVGSMNLQGIKSRMPILGKSNWDTFGNVANAAIAAPLAVVKPGALMHAAVNRGRLAAAGSGVGKRYAQGQLAEGVARATGSPKYTSRTAQTLNKAKDYLVSPAVRDPSRFTEALTNLSATNKSSANELIQAASPFAGQQATGYAAMLSGLGGKLPSSSSVVRDKIKGELGGSVRKGLQQELASGRNVAQTEAVRRLAPKFRDSPNQALREMSQDAMAALPPSRANKIVHRLQDTGKNIKGHTKRLNPWGAKLQAGGSAS